MFIFLLKLIIYVRVFFRKIELCLLLIMIKKFILFFLFPLCILAQDYNRGLQCFLAEDYVCAKKQFSFLQDHGEPHLAEYSSYYMFLSALYLYHQDTEHLFDKFVSKFPYSNKLDDACFFMAEYLFEKNKYREVVGLLSNINIYQLDENKKELAFFYLGYSAFKTENYNLAKNGFYELSVNTKSLYRDDAIFYNSYILLFEGDSAAALQGFQGLVKSKKYAYEVPYIIASILFDLNKYKQLSDYIEPLLDVDGYSHYADLVLLHAKSLYQLEKYDPAIVYFEEYKNLKDTLTVPQLYQIGMSYYHKGLYGFAINHLNKIIVDNNDNIAQYTFYYLGDSYRKIDSRVESMHAFYSAALLNADSVVQHDAFYQFVMLCYEKVNSLYDPLEYLSKFIHQYPNSEHVEEVYACLANIHLNTRNYDNAISILEQSDLQDYKLKNQYQKICYHKAVQLYNDGLYRQAILYFNKSINVSNKNELLYQAYYWMAESYYNLNAFSDALYWYAKLPRGTLYMQSLYSQGYCFLKMGEYQKSIQKFNKLIDYNVDSRMVYDSYIRLGDNYFSLMSYKMSVAYYDEALSVSGFEDDYAAYKKSTAYVLLGNYNSAIKAFNDLIEKFPDSNYLDDAIFDLGNAYILAEDFNLASECFTNIINNFQNSLFHAQSQLKLGLVYYMQNNDSQAIAILKTVSKSSDRNVSQEAIDIMKNIYNELGRSSEFVDFIQTVNHDYTKSELDSSMYYSSELQYMQANYHQAISSFNAYLSYYPNGLFSLESNYFLYKSHEKLGDFKSAIEILNEMIGQKEHKYTIEGLISLATMSYELKKYISSESYFKQLLDLASKMDVRKTAILGLLDSKFKLYKYDEVVATIASIVEDDLFSGTEKLRIIYMKAYALYKLNRNKEALSEFEWLINNTEGDLKAESFYYTALLFYSNKQYVKSQNIIFQLINELPTYRVWVNQALFLLSKNYIIQEDMFQAKHVLLELLKNCKDVVLLDEINQFITFNFPDLEIDSLIHGQ